MTYLLQVSTCWIFFFGIYLLFLRKETFFSINRYYLLGALITGLLVPYLAGFIPENNTSVEVYQVMTQFTEAQIVPTATVVHEAKPFDWMKLLWIGYLLGAGVVLSRFIFGLYRIYSIYAGSDKTQKQNYILIESDKYHLPFSFFHFIFISKQLPLNEEVEKVLKHEELHVNQWHSLDIVFTELLQVFFWFNPILVFYKNALRQSHEYLADAYVTQDHNKNSYGQLLLQQSTSGLEVALANQFFHSQIKKRITMMYKEKSKRSAMVKYLAAVPVLVGMLLIFSSNKMSEDYSQKEPIEIITNNGDPTITVLPNGAYMYDGTPLTDEEVKQVIEKVALGEKLIVKTLKGSSREKINHLIKLATERDITPIIETTKFITTNFDGRAFTVRKWPEILGKYKSTKGTITVKAEANADGKIIYTEIIKEKTTIDNKTILKDALSSAKEFEIEKGYENAIGEIVFNLGQMHLNQGYSYQENKDAFLFDKEINIGLLVPKGATKVTIEDKTLIENEDYIIDYEKGMLKLSDSYLGDKPVNVTFENTSNDDPIFKVVEEMPRFPGCEEMEISTKEKEECAKKKMLEYIYANLKYPAVARDQDVEGMVVIQFVVEKDGSIKESKIVRDIGAGCGHESQRVVNSMPVWIPGKQRGKPVRVQYTLPVKFKLQGEVEQKTKPSTVVIVGYGTPDEKAMEESLVKDLSESGYENVSFVSEQMPMFPGCEDKLKSISENEECAKHKMLEYIYKRIKYPAEARKKGIEGMAIIRFIVRKDGSLTDFKIMRNPGQGTGEAALDVISSMPKWTPGKQNGKTVDIKYTLPIKFKLENEKQNPQKVENLLKGKKTGIKIDGSDPDSKIVLRTSDGKGAEPLFVIDGKVQPKPVMEKIDPDDIKDINILKGEKAIEKYNEAGENGVVEITMKAAEKYTFKTSLKYPLEQFKQIKDLSYILKDAGLKKESMGNVLSYTMVKVAEKEDAQVVISKEDKFNSNINDLISETKANDRYFFEKVIINTDGKEENIGTVSVLIVEGMPTFANPMFVINGKIESGDWMNSINPEDIESMSVVKGEKLIEKYGNISHNSVIEITLKPGKKLTKYVIEGQLYNYMVYNTIDQDHIKSERPATEEEKFIRGIDHELIVVNMELGHGYNSAYFPGTHTEDGSTQALLEYVGNNIEYPSSAMTNNIEGTVIAKYTVNANGTLSDFQIQKSVGWGLDDAVLNMLESMAVDKGPWKAAYLDNKSVSSTMLLPVKFKLQDHQVEDVKTRRLNIDNFKISPNPNDGRFNLAFELEEDLPVVINFYSLNGQLLKTIESASSRYQAAVDLSEFSGQTVLINIVQNGKVYTNKVIIQ